MPTQSDSFRSPRVRSTLLLWSLFLLTVFGGGWFKAVENARDEQAANEWQAHFLSLQKAGDAEWTRVSDRFRELNGKPDSQRRLEIELNDGRPFDSNPGDPTNPYTWTDAKYGFTFHFGFRDGTLNSSIGHSGTGYLLSVCPQPHRFSRDSFAEAIRKPLGPACGYAWLACVGVWFAIPKRRYLSAQLSLAVAITAGMAWLVNPFYTLRAPGIFHNEILFFAALMLFGSVYLLSATIVELNARGISLPTLQFRLRELLAITVIVSVVLFAGPFGYVTLLASLVGILVFAITYLVHRRWNPFRMQSAPA